MLSLSLLLLPQKLRQVQKSRPKEEIDSVERRVKELLPASWSPRIHQCPAHRLPASCSPKAPQCTATMHGGFARSEVIDLDFLS